MSNEEKKESLEYLCPVCGYGMDDPPENYNICPCCGTEFGLGDANRSHAEIRAEWVKGGAKWWSPVDPAPVCNPPEPSGDTPSAQAYASARKILTKAYEIKPIFLEATAIEASDGDLLIHWGTATRGVVLICPGNGQAPSIYKETLEGVSATGSQLLSDATATSLSEALAWVQSS